MAHGQETGSGKPALRQALQARGPDLDLIFGLPSGPAACDGRIEGRTHVSTRPRATPLSKISLAPKGASTHVAKFFRARFVRNLRSAEPSLTRPEVEIRSSERPNYNQKLGHAAFSRSSHTGPKNFATGPIEHHAKLERIMAEKQNVHGMALLDAPVRLGSA